ncbi:helix-turn-helix transcriptional regulator [Pseudovibrio ascidiaceicola]|nr:helix-turn-helix transcriptional regulator [Pseudovibrio ascidiaceicola]
MTPLLDQSISDIFRTFMNEEPLENALKQLQTKYSEFPFAINVQSLADRHYDYRKVLNVGQAFHDSFAPVAQLNPLPSVLKRVDIEEPCRPHRHFRKEDIHADYVGNFIEPNQNIDRAITLMIDRQNGLCSYINISLPYAVSENDEDQLFEEVKFLQPYFRNAFQLALQRRMREAVAPTKALGKFWLEQMPFSALVVDENSSVQVMNGRAEKLLSKHTNLQLGRYMRLSAKAVDEASALESAVRQSIYTHTLPSPVIIRNEFGPNTLVFIQPIETQKDAPDYLSHFLARPKYCLLMVFDPTDFAEVPDKMISHLLNLTPKETEVVKALTNGASTRDAAEQLGISYNTARNHIANVSRRLDVGSQTEIVRLVMTTLSRYPWQT